MSAASGFLVVRSGTLEYANERNAQYQGVDRVPAYPSEIEFEQEAMDAYVFGDFKDPETGLIPSLSKAQELLKKFSASPRGYEIIMCKICLPNNRDKVQPLHVNEGSRFLGVDVASIGGDWWSIVGDFPNDKRLAKFILQLNDNGLFSTLENAEDYQKEYRALSLPDWDCGLGLLLVYRIAH